MKGRKAQARLEARQRVYDEHGQNPSQNPSNGNGRGHDMHRPGSNNK
jgi:hypothetical protein